MTEKRNSHRPHDGGSPQASIHTTNSKPRVCYVNPDGTEHEPSAWLRGLLADVTRKFTAGRMTPCCKQKQVLFMANRPARTWCPVCALVPLHHDKETSEQWACDRCRQVNVGACASLVFPVPIGGHLLRIGFGLCPACQLKEFGVVR